MTVHARFQEAEYRENSGPASFHKDIDELTVCEDGFELIITDYRVDVEEAEDGGYTVTAVYSGQFRSRHKSWRPLDESLPLQKAIADKVREHFHSPAGQEALYDAQQELA